MNSDKKITIFDQLNLINKHNIEPLNEEDSKQFVPLLAMRWLTGSSDESQILRVNDRLNPYVFTLYKHKDLLWKLACASSNGKTKKYTWLKSNSSKNKHKLTLQILSEYYQISDLESKEYLSIINEEDVIQMANELGYDKDQITKVKAEFK